MSDTKPCGIKDPLSPRRCALPAGHGGTHRDTEIREAAFADPYMCPTPPPPIQPSPEPVDAAPREAETAPRCGASPNPGSALCCDRPMGHEGNHSMWSRGENGVYGHTNWAPDPAPSPPPAPRETELAGGIPAGEVEAIGSPSSGILAAFRAASWSVAVHNDYRLNGEAHTFWLLTHPDGRYVKGEGRSDSEALIEARKDLARFAGGSHG